MLFDDDLFENVTVGGGFGFSGFFLRSCGRFGGLFRDFIRLRGFFFGNIRNFFDRNVFDLAHRRVFVRFEVGQRGKLVGFVGQIQQSLLQFVIAFVFRGPGD